MVVALSQINFPVAIAQYLVERLGKVNAAFSEYISHFQCPGCILDAVKVFSFKYVSNLRHCLAKSIFFSSWRFFIVWKVHGSQIISFAWHPITKHKLEPFLDIISSILRINPHQYFCSEWMVCNYFLIRAFRRYLMEQCSICAFHGNFKPINHSNLSVVNVISTMGRIGQRFPNSFLACAEQMNVIRGLISKISFNIELSSIRCLTRRLPMLCRIREAIQAAKSMERLPKYIKVLSMDLYSYSSLSSASASYYRRL